MEWININDQKPEKFSEIIICTNEGKVKSAIYMGDGKFNTFIPVAYWMQLPEPPKISETIEASKEEVVEKPVEPVKKKRGRPKKS